MADFKHIKRREQLSGKPVQVITTCNCNSMGVDFDRTDLLYQLSEDRNHIVDLFVAAYHHFLYSTQSLF
jgi:hypothetical protein